MRLPRRPLDATVLTLGFALLYLPIVLLVVYSFNDNRNVTVWGGFSTRWYASIFANAELIAATATSLLLALATATGATMIGTLAAIVLVRFGRFAGRPLFGAMIYAPIVMPEILTGLSMLLLFISLGIERGFWTVLISHVTFTASFVAVVVQSRLIGFDRHLEEAAMDLGSTPLHAFFSVTLPLIAPAVAAGWLLAFVLSFDDLLISRFTTGPGTNTLPMVIYAEARRGVKPEINAMCTVLIIAVATSVIAVALAAKWRERRSQGDTKAS